MKFNYKDTAKIEKRAITIAAKKLAPYFEVLKNAVKDSSYKTDESSLYLSNDREMRKKALKLVKLKQSKKLKEVMVVGIGGSNLGAQAVYGALRPKGVKLSFFDTAHARSLKEAIIRLKQIFGEGNTALLNIISKSGTTNETVMNARVLLKELQKLAPDWNNHVVATTEPGSKLEAWARFHEIDALPNPVAVGGRYSVLCPVGTFPLALSGVDIRKLHKGASKMLEKCLSQDSESNPALQSASAVFRAIGRGISMHNLFVYDEDLEYAGKWFRQLTGESLGKQGKGITPIVSIGSTDMHSMFQLYMAGPKDKFTTFVKVASGSDIKIPNLADRFDDIVRELSGKSVGKVMDAIYEATKQSYVKRELPFVEVILESLDEEELGAFMQFKMVETMLLAKLMGINAFDQPDVEDYKIITRRLLA